MNDECTEHERHDGVTRDAEAERRNETCLRCSVVRRFRGDNPFDGAPAKAFRALGPALFESVGDERRDGLPD